jgi:hypothetical protein
VTSVRSYSVCYESDSWSDTYPGDLEARRDVQSFLHDLVAATLRFVAGGS